MTMGGVAGTVYVTKEESSLSVATLEDDQPPEDSLLSLLMLEDDWPPEESPLSVRTLDDDRPLAELLPDPNAAPLPPRPTDVALLDGEEMWADGERGGALDWPPSLPE